MKYLSYLPLVLIMILTSCQESGKMILTEVEAGEVIIIPADKEFTIKLISNQSTGYEWKLSAPIDSNLLSHRGTVYKLNNKYTDGGGGFEHWHFKALKKGKCIIKLHYFSPWENEEPLNKLAYVINIE